MKKLIEIRRNTLWGVFLCLLAIGEASAAGVFVPRMELYTHGILAGDSLELRTSGNIEMALEGGYKLGGNLVFKLDSSDLENLSGAPDAVPVLEYKYGSVTIKDILGIPLDFSYFVGEGDLLCEGRSFTRTFGTQNFSTKYAGFLYFSGGDHLYEGISRIDGTGISLASSFGTENFKSFLYTYQDSQLGYGKYTSVARGLLDTENLKLEGYLSASYPEGDAGLYGGGVLFFYRPTEMGEFFAQIGIPRWNPLDDNFGADLFYFLFEPRLNLGLVSIVMTYFLRPAYYLMEATEEEGNMDINLNFLLGKQEVTPLSGGVETTARMASDSSGSAGSFFNLSLSPYFGAITSGVVWDCKLKINVVKTETTPLFEGFIGVKAEF